MKNNLFKIFIFLVSIFLFVFDFNINPTISKNIVEIDIDLPFVEIREDEEEKYINVKNSDIYKNDHYRFNLLIDNTSFKEPIYQYSDNDYYLTHNGLGKKQKSGATYMDYRVSVNSKKILIYGHNNDKLSLPFSVLENYNDFEYYKKHKYLYIEKDDTVLKYEIFSVYVETSNWDYMNINFDSKYAWFNHVYDLKSRSIYDTGVDINMDDSILILQTCSKDKKYESYSKKYLLVIAKLVK